MNYNVDVYMPMCVFNGVQLCIGFIFYAFHEVERVVWNWHINICILFPQTFF